MKNYFSFTRSQQIGLILWITIILALVVAPEFLEQPDFDEKFLVNESDIEYIKFNAESGFNNGYTNFENKSETKILTDFDPNLLDAAGWEELDFSAKQADIIVNYREKYGRFRKKEDLKKIFVISEEKYLELEPFIVINEFEETEKIQADLISLNNSTVADLETLPTIGPKFAERIIKFRNSLGGFTSMTQLHEVYNMTEEIYQVLVDHTEIESGEIVRIKINSASKDEIDKHPYIDFDVTAAILKQREQRRIENLDFLIEKNLITREEKDRIEPYISFE